MAEYIFHGELQTSTNLVKVKLLLFHFEDENKINFIYSPHLDLSGYGISLEEAQQSFQLALEDFIDYTLKKKTFRKVLLQLGWSIKGLSKKPKRILAPSITTIISENKYISEIFDKYPVNTFHEEVGLPVFA